MEAEPIGVSVPLTGPAATYGVDVKNIFLFLNELKGKDAHRLIIEDDKCDPREAVTIAHRLMGIPALRFVMGYPCSGTITAVAPLYEKRKIILMSAAAAAPAVSQAGEFVFRTRPSELAAVSLLVDYVSARFNRISLINEETEYAQSLADSFASALAVSVQAQRLSFHVATTDLSSLVLRVKHASPQAFVVFTQAESGLLLAVQALKRARVNAPLISSIFPPAPSFLKAAGPDADGIVFATLPFFEDAGTEEGKALLRQFVSQYGPMQSTDHLFFTTHAAFSVIDQLTSTTSDPRKLLYSTTFAGLYGPFSFNAEGDIRGISHMLKVIRNGRPVNLVPGG